MYNVQAVSVKIIMLAVFYIYKRKLPIMINIQHKQRKNLKKNIFVKYYFVS